MYSTARALLQESFRPQPHPTIVYLYNHVPMNTNDKTQVSTIAIQKVEPSDAEPLVREVDYPAIKTHPLFRAMFPHIHPASEEVIQWYIDGCKEAIAEDQDFRKAVTPSGRIVGFCALSSNDMEYPKASTGDKGAPPPLPAGLDVRAWMDISRKLRAERNRVTADLGDAYRKLLDYGIILPAMLIC